MGADSSQQDAVEESFDGLLHCQIRSILTYISGNSNQPLGGLRHHVWLMWGGYDNFEVVGVLLSFNC